MFFSSFRFTLCPAASMLEKLLNITKNSGNLKLTPHRLSEYRHFLGRGRVWRLEASLIWSKGLTQFEAVSNDQHPLALSIQVMILEVCRWRGTLSLLAWVCGHGYKKHITNWDCVAVQDYIYMCVKYKKVQKK